MLTALDVHFLGQRSVIACCLLDGGSQGLALVDPGPSTSLAGLRAALAGKGRALAEVDAILLTHIHLDHAGGTGTIVREHPRVQVYVHERGAPHMVDPTRLRDSAARLYGADMERLWGEMAPVPPANVHVLSGGETVRAAGRNLQVAYTPGHASHHVSYLDMETGTALVGDTGGVRVGAWPVVLPPTPPPDIDLEEWEASLDRILAWSPDSMFLTHFGRFADPGSHVDQFRQWMGELVAIAAAVHADASLDESARMATFAAALHARIADRAGEDAAAAYTRAVPFEHCWLGLARYLSKKG